MAPPRTVAAATFRIKDVLLFLSVLLSASLILYLHHLHLHSSNASFSERDSMPSPPLSFRRILFSIASSSASVNSRAPYIRLWYSPISRFNTTYVFLDRLPPQPAAAIDVFPPIVIQRNVSSRISGHRIARVIKDAVALDVPGIDWYVFGDDDTLFFPQNLMRILSKYDHNHWFYVGCNSENYEQNQKFYFDMAFGGGGFAISAPLARVLARVLDSCLDRYSHLYGSDARIFSCLAELGLRLTVEPGFHQVDVRGNLYGLLAAHPVALVASLHHIDAIEPIFPHMSRIEALEHLFKAMQADPARIFQQSVCYNASNSLTVSISWGYSIEIYEGNQLLPELFSVQRTFRPWRRGRNASGLYMFNTREYARDPCRRPVVFFLNSVVANTTGVWTNYIRHDTKKCARAKAIEELKGVDVFSVVADLDSEKMKSLRRHCCDICSISDEKMIIRIRKCGALERIAMRG